MTRHAPMATSPEPRFSWPDSATYWRDPARRRDRRCGALCVGSFIVEKHQARGAAEVTVPRIEE